MNTRYRLVHRGIRGGMYYCFDKVTGKRASINTTNEDAARQIIEAKNQAVRQPAINLQIAQAYLQHGDPVMAKRTWQDVMDAMAPLKTGPTQRRWTAAMRDKAFDLIRHRKLMETASELIFAGSQFGNCLDEYVFAPPAQFRSRDALASLAGVCRNFTGRQ
jgi:hypothetical protein